jgi:hypothetical protein
MLGKASPHVFCAHLAFVFVGLGFLYGTVSQLHGFYAVGLVALTFGPDIRGSPQNPARKAGTDNQ